MPGHEDGVLCVAFHPEDELLASASRDTFVMLWRTSIAADVHTSSTGPAHEWLQTLRGHRAAVAGVAWVLTKAACAAPVLVLVSASLDGTLRVWVPSQPPSPSRPCVAQVAQKVAQFAHAHTLVGHRNAETGSAAAVHHVAPHPFVPNLAASASTDKTVRLWDVAAGTLLKTYSGHTSTVRCVAFHPDPGARLLCSSSWENHSAIKLWDTAEGTCTRTLAGHSSAVLCVAFQHHHSPAASPAASGARAVARASVLLASGAVDTTVKLWEPHTGRCTQTLRGHTRPVYCVAFHPTQPELLASTSDHGSVRIWCHAKGVCALSFAGHRLALECVAFHATNPNVIATAAMDRDAPMRLWLLPIGRPWSAQEHTRCFPPLQRVVRTILQAQGRAEEDSALWLPEDCWHLVFSYLHDSHFFAPCLQNALEGSDKGAA